jgi:hypothetical protein
MRKGGNHSRDSLKVIVMPHHEEAAADKTVNLAFLFRELGPLGRNRIGNDGVVVTPYCRRHNAFPGAAPLFQQPVASHNFSKLRQQCLKL